MESSPERPGRAIGDVVASGAAAVAIGGSVHAPVTTHYYASAVGVPTGRQPYDLTVLIPQEVTVPAYLRRQPSRLMAAAHRIVDFHGRGDELARLARWRDEPGEFEVFLVHGVGGQGKSRLAMEFTDRSAARGWNAFQGSLAASGLPPSVDLRQLPPGESGRLVVVDYAERWPVELLCGLLGDARLHDARTRVLLVARPAGRWWARIASHLTRRLSVEPDRIHLGPLSAHDGDRERLFAEARDRFALVLGVPDVTEINPPADWSRGATALDIQMAALAAVYAAGRDETVPNEHGALSAYLLGREQEHWAELHATAHRPTTPETMGRAVYLACLAGPMRYDQAGAVLVRTSVSAPGAETNAVLDDHRLCYPASSSDMTFLPLRPDRMAEDFIALLSSSSLTGSFEADPWTAGRAPAILAALESVAPDQATAMLMRAALVAQGSDSFAREHLAPLIAAHPDAVLARGGPLLLALVEVPALPPASLAALEARMPLEGPPDLMDVLATITARLNSWMREALPVQEATVALGMRLVRRMNLAGRHTEAARVADQLLPMLSMHWPLVSRRRPRAVSVSIALLCLAETYAGLDRCEEALSIADDAIRRAQSVHAEAVESRIVLAEAFFVRADMQSRKGDRLAAVRDGREAVAVLRPLASAGAVPQHRLARALGVLARYELDADLGRLAYLTAERAIEVWRRVGAESADGSRSDLFETLMLVAESRAASINRRLDAVAEASEGFGRLWARDITLLPSAAGALRLRAELSGRAGRHDAALRYARRARAAANHLADRDGDRHRDLSVRCQLTYARCCLNSGQDLEEGLAAARQAAASAEPQVGAARTEIERITVGLLRALGRDEEAERTAVTAEPQVDGAFERPARFVRRAALPPPAAGRSADDTVHPAGPAVE